MERVRCKTTAGRGLDRDGYRYVRRLHWQDNRRRHERETRVQG